MASSLIRQFEEMHLNHLAAEHKTDDYCRQAFLEKLKKWSRKRKAANNLPKTHTYTDVCKDKRHKRCKYVIKVFNDSDAGRLQFAHELRTLKQIQDAQADFVPAVHTAFLCKNYGLLVQEKWSGDILDLLFAQKEDRVEETFQRAHHQAQVMMAELHRLRLCYGRNKIDFRNVIYCAKPDCPDVMKSQHGFHLGLQDWRGARTASDAFIAQDMHQINVLFMEIAHLVQSMRHKRPIPDHVPHGMRAKAEKLREW